MLGQYAAVVFLRRFYLFNALEAFDVRKITYALMPHAYITHVQQHARQ
jgi:hypothetical protein